MRRALTVKNAVTENVELPEAFPKLERVDLLTPQTVEAGVYIVDPNGNLVLYYDMARNPKDILQDLKKMLRVSQIG